MATRFTAQLSLDDMEESIVDEGDDLRRSDAGMTTVFVEHHGVPRDVSRPIGFFETERRGSGRYGWVGLNPPTSGSKFPRRIWLYEMVQRVYCTVLLCRF